MAIKKSWQTWQAGVEGTIPGNLGVFEIGDADGNVLEVGFAGARSPFGLRGVLSERFAHPGEARLFRYEVNQMYRTRFIELQRQAGVSPH